MRWFFRLLVLESRFSGMELMEVGTEYFLTGLDVCLEMWSSSLLKATTFFEGS